MKALYTFFVVVVLVISGLKQVLLSSDTIFLKHKNLQSRYLKIKKSLKIFKRLNQRPLSLGSPPNTQNVLTYNVQYF